MKNLLFVLISSIFFVVNNGYSQTDTTQYEFIKEGHLKGLRKANPKEIDPSKKIKLDGVSIPVYTAEGQKVQGMKMMEILMSGDFIPDFYFNESKETKAFVLRKATEEEKKLSAERKQKIQSANESIGKIATPFSVTDLKGNKFSLEELKGKVIVINFWFIGCKPCVMEMPELNKLVKKYKDKNVVFLGFSTDEQPQLDTFLKKREFSYNIIPNSGELTVNYNVNSFPTHIIIDGDSKIVYRSTGLSYDTFFDLNKTINSLIKK